MKEKILDPSRASESPSETAPIGHLPLDSIIQRAEATRQTSAKHVKDLMESISAVGLIQPIVVDSDGVLLAGGHRLEALRLLKEKRPETFDSLFPEDSVPVRAIALENGEPGARRALEIELSENEKRRDYTGKEIATLVGRLKNAGYSVSTGGPRKKGGAQKHLTEALATILGKSRRHAQRLLSSSSAAVKPTGKEAATARCLRAMEQVLVAAAEDGTLEEAAQMLTEEVGKKANDLKEKRGKADDSRKHAA